MASHVIDFISIQNNYGTPAMREVWSEKARFAQQLKVERALALAEGKLGVIPCGAAKHIARVADIQYYDIADLAAANTAAKHSLVGTLKHIQKLAGDDGQYVHYGATTQDILDTGFVLQIREAHRLLKEALRDVITRLDTLAQTYKDTPMSGRTHGVHAIPFTFGFRLSIYLAELGRHLDRLREIEPRLFTGNLGGAIGTYASYGEKGEDIEREAMKILHLHAPEISWHSSRDRFAEYAEVLSLLAGTLGKLATDFFILMGNEIDEIEEPFSKGEVGSSTMPQKRNPVYLEGIASLVRPAFHAADLARDAMLIYHERDAIHWKMEWIAIPEVSLYVSAQLSQTEQLLSGLVVKKENMLRDLEADHGLIVSERLMFELGKKVGKQTAHQIIYRVAMEAQETGQPFRSLLLSDPETGKYFTVSEIEALTNPVNYTGLSAKKVDEIHALAKEKHWIGL